MHNFKVGDRVTYKLELFGLTKKSGTLIHILNINNYLVQFDNRDAQLHGGGGIGVANSCWWCNKDTLEREDNTFVTKTQQQLICDKILYLEQKFKSRQEAKKALLSSSEKVKKEENFTEYYERIS